MAVFKILEMKEEKMPQPSIGFFLYGELVKQIL